MTKTISATEARVHFGDVLRGVTERGETIFVERGGKPQAVVISIEEYDRLRSNGEPQDDWWTLVEKSRQRIARELNGRPMPDIVQLINDAREERDEEILAAVLRR
jgi:prevent-host-death family protein